MKKRNKKEVFCIVSTLMVMAFLVKIENAYGQCEFLPFLPLAIGCGMSIPSDSDDLGCTLKGNGLEAQCHMTAVGNNFVCKSRCIKSPVGLIGKKHSVMKPAIS